MANITFVIGNGFDLRIGLKTKYIHFYEEYIKEKTNDNDLIRRFKKSILQDEAQSWINWSDFEMGMGQQSEEFNGKPNDFLACLDDFVVNFNDYLKKVCEKVEWTNLSANIINEFSNSIISFREKIYTSHRSAINHIMTSQSGRKINFLQLNYTYAFDMLLKKSNITLDNIFRLESTYRSYGVNSLGENYHIHGLLDKRPIIGVDNVEQIKCEKIRADVTVAKVFVKQNYLAAIQARTVDIPIEAKKALTTIQNSDIICVYGASIGDTDKYWWQQIGNWLKNPNKLLIIFDICGEEDDGVSITSFLSRDTDVETKKNQIIERFIRLAEWQQEEIDNNKDKIIIELDSEMFNFKLPMIKDK